MGKNYFLRMVYLVIALWYVACKPQANKEGMYDSTSHGQINISVDESFKPVIDAQIAMYHNTYPDARIAANYKPEAECLKDLFRDSATRMIIITRQLSEKENQFFLDSLGYIPGSNAVATDAVAVIINKANADSLITLERLRNQLAGKLNRQQKIVFDGLSATSTVRYITDSVLKGEKFDTSVVNAAKTSKEVLDYVAANTNAIGLIGISWIGNPEEAEQVAMLEKIKLAYVECLACDSTPFVKPVQQSILSHRYPLVRGLYYIVKEGYPGLGSGFASFLKNERGQLIFRRAYLGPVMQLEIRNVRLNEKLPAKK